MPRLSRRGFLRSGAGVVAGAASWLTLGKAPTFAQKGQQSFLAAATQGKLETKGKP
jgi:hypothetical protein